jgi:hypothetical protein
MTHWGYLLLIAAVAIGLSSTGERKAMKIVVGLTVASLVYAFHTYGGL